MQLSRAEIDDFIDRALAEDVGRGDLTSYATIPEGTQLKVAMVARQEVVVCGIDIAMAVFKRVRADIETQALVKDGEKVNAKTVLARFSGDARAILEAERTALNILQHLSGIATVTRRYAELVEGTGATLIDTRKTIPTLRNLAKYASFTGGARNHRLRLDDGVLIKDNHIAACGSLTAAVQRAKRVTPALTVVEVECDTLDQVKEAVAAGAGMILLDNMEPALLKQAVAIVAGRAVLEASGGITLETIRDKASSGVDFVSVGRMTQSAPAVDIGLDYGV
ncbi:MAG TPA: carboxylating nicotinate-nucleotide diphosphorylase [Alphaproteobacteria bacterium]|nr:carboxylating nicotinate-nucleotide diphosphorylase [Alphaproteobacteria bacterium]